MKYLITTKRINSKDLPFNKEKILFIKKGSFYIYYTGKDITLFQDFIAFTEGYLFDMNVKIDSKEKQKISAYKSILMEWPVPDHISGSFSTSIINSNSITICNDCIGIYPLYYYIKNKELIISTDIYWMAFAKSDAEIDEVGLLQKTLGSENATIGSRTILKNVKRVLPGENINFSLNTSIEVQKKYDNTLFKIDDNYTLNKASLEKYWDNYTKEINYLLNNDQEDFIALSGGMDSRILLGAIPSKIKLSCLTYGEQNNYEVSIARRLAKTKKYSFNSYYDPDLYFPPLKTFNKYIRESESLRIASWLEILENIDNHSNSYLLLGDMCEVLPARNIKKYASKNKRIANFFSHFILKQLPKFTKSDSENFEHWKNKILNSELKRLTSEKILNLSLSIDYDKLIREMKKDYEEIFFRIESHNLPYSELYSELFSWYTHARVPMGQQVLTCNQKFKAVCPPMSTGILRLSSGIHPKYRMNYRFMNKLFKNTIELKELNSIPTNQSPFVNRNFSDLLIFLVWGLRSVIDQYLVKRLMKHKKSNMRYSFLKSINWVQIYNRKNVVDNTKDYFFIKNKQIYTEEKKAMNILEERINLERWPHANFDILGIASINSQLSLIKSIIKKGTSN